MQGPIEPPGPLPSARHELRVRCADEVQVLIRVLNFFAVARARVLAVHCESGGQDFELRVASEGLTRAQAETLLLRVAGLERVEAAAVMSLNDDCLRAGGVHA